MNTRDQVCRTLRTLSPDVGPCGDRIQTAYDLENQAWVLTLKQDNKELKTYVDNEDVALCMEGKQCLGLGFELFQLKDNLRYKGGRS